MPEAWHGSNPMKQSNQTASVSTVANKSRLAKRTAGMRNLGHTCYLNSSIQCLANVPTLRDYFLTNRYQESVKVRGQLTEGTQGNLADGFVTLLRQLWSETTSIVNPSSFKLLVGKVSSRFNGFEQHDAQEFIENLIDGLKEDCNWVKGKKPYVERKEADGRPDEEVALEAGNGFLLRNDSGVDDLFVGFLRSTTTCPECGKRSVVFDPTLSVKLPVLSPTESQRETFTVTVVPMATSGCPITRRSVSLAKGGKVVDLIQAVAAEAGIDDVERCLLVEISDGKSLKLCDDDDVLMHIFSDDGLLLYELDVLSSNADSVHLVICRQARVNEFGQLAIVGLPLVFCLPSKDEVLEVAVRRELTLRYGPRAVSGWRMIMRNVDGPYRRGGGLQHQTSLVVEWEPECSVLSQVMEERKEGLVIGGLCRAPQSEDVVTLQRCFEWFTEAEQLSEDDAVYCSSCKAHRRVFKKVEFWSLPPVLVVQLKRFEHNGPQRRRLGNKVRFPLEGLDLSHLWSSGASSFPRAQCLRANQMVEIHGLRSAPKLNGVRGVAKYLDTVTGRFCVCLHEDDAPEDWKKVRPENLRPVSLNGSSGTEVPPPLYDLIAMCMHTGNMSFGHYVAHARSSEDAKWRLFDDDDVTIVDPEEVQRAQSSAYVLFYIRRDFRPPAWGPARAAW